VRDTRDPDLLATALRETEEEIGLAPRVVEILGTLPPVATITGYAITAFVGRIPHPYEFRPNPREVERLLILPLDGFLPPERWSSGPYVFQGQVTRVCCWRHDQEVVWGATARILLNLLAALGHHPIPGDRDVTCVD
jgi:8-oxo-dGTP pyrophosphatase MutT (NUDIX family)